MMKIFKMYHGKCFQKYREGRVIYQFLDKYNENY